MKIIDINLKIIKDSRGADTLESEMQGGDFLVKASVPAGKSRGVHEAFVLESKKAIEKFAEIKAQIVGREFENQEEFDNFLISLDGTPDKRNLGANLILALSLAFARLKARVENRELFRYVQDLFAVNSRDNISDRLVKLPHPIFNMINGGTHARNKLNFQEFQVIPYLEADKRGFDTNHRSGITRIDFGLAYGIGKEFYEKLGQFLEKKFSKENISLGDEAGYSAPFSNNEEAIEVLAEVIEKYKYPLRIGLDVAASQLYKQPTTGNPQQGFYLIDSKKYTAEELRDYYLKLIKSYNILSIEDPFYEEDFNSFAAFTTLTYTDNTRTYTENKHNSVKSALSSHKSALVIADDLTTTNPERLKTAIEKKSGNAIIIKPNQIGTLTETLKVVKMVYENNWQAIVSNRSGETMDDFIADLAVGIGAWGLKAGAPGALERLVKYDRVLTINSKLQNPNSKQITNLKF